MPAYVNSVMVRRARERASFTRDLVADRLGVKREKIVAWEEGTDYPSIRNAFDLAKLFRCPLSYFYLSEEPKDTSIAQRDFRRLPDTDMSSASPELTWEERNAVSRRAMMIDLSDSESEGVFEYSETVLPIEPADEVGKSVRQRLGLTMTIQGSWGSYSEGLKWLRSAIERQNVLVFSTRSEGQAPFVTVAEARGFAISAERYPVIVLNSKDAHSARIFTLIHEYTHLLLGVSAISDARLGYGRGYQIQEVEQFCNAVAGETLAPKAELERWIDDWRLKDASESELDTAIARLAEVFWISEEAITRRLYSLEVVSQSFYTSKRRQLSERRSGGEDSQGFGAKYRHKLLNWHGRRYPEAIIAAYHDGQLSALQAANCLDTTVPQVRDLSYHIF